MRIQYIQQLPSWLGNYQQLESNHKKRLSHSNLFGKDLLRNPHSDGEHSERDLQTRNNQLQSQCETKCQKEIEAGIFCGKRS